MVHGLRKFKEYFEDHTMPHLRKLLAIHCDRGRGYCHDWKFLNYHRYSYRSWLVKDTSYKNDTL